MMLFYEKVIHQNNISETSNHVVDVYKDILKTGNFWTRPDIV